MGSADQAPWESDPQVRARQTDVQFPVSWWKWTKQTVRFTPVADGTVELWLHGPWSPEKDGVMPRKEVLWDDVQVDGAELKNGGFEEREGTGPAGWNSPWGEWPGESDWPLKGTEAFSGDKVAAAWCKRPLMQTMRVTAGKTVTLTLLAKAATVPGFEPPKRLAPPTPAHQALARIKRGVNLGNGWEAPPPNSWGVRFTTEDIDHIANEGFDHIRVPVAWHFHVREENGRQVIDPMFLAEIEPVLKRALDRRLHVMLNWHHFHDFTKDPDAHVERFTAVWGAIARHFQAWPPELFFELLNEPCDELTTARCNPAYQKTIRLIRETNPQRIIVVSPGHWGGIGELENLRLPDDDDRIVVTVHCYEPFHFTHQGAGWVGLQALKGVRYPGPPDNPLALPESLRENQSVRAFLDGYNQLPSDRNPSSPRTLREMLDTARDWSRYFGRPVHLGEFGAHQPGDPASRGRYLRDVRNLAEERGIPWTLWEWKAGFGYWNPQANRPNFRKELME